jgi:putative DNA primase/helicase
MERAGVVSEAGGGSNGRARPEGVEARVEAVVAAKDVRAAYDEGLVRDMAALRASDPSEYLALTARLRSIKGFSIREFEKMARRLGDGDDLVTPISDPHALAREFAAGRYGTEGAPRGCRTAHYHKGFVYEWDGGCYHPRPDRELKAEVSAFLEGFFISFYESELAAWVGGGRADGRPTLRPVTTRIVTDVFAALQSVLLLTERDVPGLPAWVGPQPDGWRPEDVLASPNALVHLPTAAGGGPGSTAPPTPAFFSASCTDYGYEPGGPDPERWLRFLDEVLPGDAEAVALVQEFLGYLLTPATSQQKMLMLCGAPRSGKGTVARVFKGVLGAANCAGATVAALSGGFGLSTLIHKRVLMLAEAGATKTDSAHLAAILKAVSGEDDIQVDIKYKEPWIGRLGARVVLTCNEPPQMADASGALGNRFLFVRFSQSFLGKEDPRLTNRLLAERAAILNWAIRGLARLRERGHFVQPQSGVPLRDQFVALSGPVKAFVNEECVLGPGLECEKDVLFQDYVRWCESANTHAGTRDQFARDLYSACPGVGDARPRVDGGRSHLFTGIDRADPTPARTAADWWLAGYLVNGGGRVDITYREAKQAGFQGPEIDRAAAVLGAKTYVMGGVPMFERLVLSSNGKG